MMNGVDEKLLLDSDDELLDEGLYHNHVPEDEGSSPKNGVSGGEVEGSDRSINNAPVQNSESADVEIEGPSQDALLQSVAVEKKRWYILFVFCLLAFTQVLIFNSWGPIAGSAEFALGWEDKTIALQANLASIAFLFLAIPVAWLMDVKGMRWAMAISAFWMALGASLRCITLDQPAATYLIYAGQLLNGMASPVIMAGPPLLSSVWFPARQRTTATAIGTMAGLLGMAMTFIVGPQLVSDVSDHACNNQSSPDHNSSECSHLKEKLQDEIRHFMLAEGVLAVVVFLMIVIYFPTCPQHSPSFTATTSRLDFRRGFAALSRNGRFWMLLVSYGVSTGVFLGWASVLDVNLKAIGVNQETAGWIGFSGFVASIIAVVVFGVFADIFARTMKRIVLVQYTIGLLAYLIFTLQCAKVIPVTEHSNAVLFSMNILGNTAILGTTPLFFELGCETSYPVAEGITNTFMTLADNAVATVFLLLLLINSIGTAWLNWCLVGALAACIPVVYFFKESYTRLDIDSEAAAHRKTAENSENIS